MAPNDHRRGRGAGAEHANRGLRGALGPFDYADHESGVLFALAHWSKRL